MEQKQQKSQAKSHQKLRVPTADISQGVQRSDLSRSRFSMGKANSNADLLANQFPSRKSMESIEFFVAPPATPDETAVMLQNFLSANGELPRNIPDYVAADNSLQANVEANTNEGRRFHPLQLLIRSFSTTSVGEAMAIWRSFSDHEKHMFLWSTRDSNRPILQILLQLAELDAVF